MKSSANNKKENEKWMAHAVGLAKKGLGRTSPNPIVGAVIVKNGKCLAQGFHERAGGDHAEIIALQKLKPKQCEGATLYVTLEPCSFHGKTPPCVASIIQSKIRRVVIGARDPNPKVYGRGMHLLRRAGIQITEGILKESCESLNRPFQKWITKGIPFVTLKIAQTLDGKIATFCGDSKWITNLECRKRVHELRSQVDAILIGTGTLTKDDPLLNVRYGKLRGRRNSTVVIVDEKLAASPNARVFHLKNRKVILATTNSSSQKKRKFFEKKGVKVWLLPKSRQGFVDLKSLLKRLGQEEVLHLLVEGGASIFSSLIQQRLVDYLMLFTAPKILGSEGKGWSPSLKLKKMKEVLPLKNISVERVGDAILMEGDFSF